MEGAPAPKEPASDSKCEACATRGTEGESEDRACFRTAGNSRGENAFAISFGAQLLSYELMQSDRPVPDVVFVDLEAPAFVPKLENYLFFQLFCSAFQDGIGGQLDRLNRAIVTFEKGGVRAPDAEIARRNEIVGRARAIGFEPLLTPGAPVLLSRRITVFVPDEEQRKRAKELLQNVFIHRSGEYLAGKLREFQDRQEEGIPRLSGKAIDRITAGFEAARSFAYSPGVFFNPVTGHPFTDREIFDDRLDRVIDIRVLGADPETVLKGAGEAENRIEVRRDGERILISESGNETTIPQSALHPPRNPLRRWRPKCAATLREILDCRDGVPRLIDFGTGDALYVGSGEDFTNLALVFDGRLLLIDPSETTLRNLTDLDLLGSVETIYLSHVHYDHVGGVLELALRFVEGAPLPRFRLMCAAIVLVQLREVLQILTGKEWAAFDELFERMPPAGTANSSCADDPDGDVEVFRPDGGAFKEFSFFAMRTHGHPLPTYALRIAGPTGTAAYLVDSAMPPVTDGGKPHPRHRDFLNFFGAASGVDHLIADAADVVERRNSVHMAPSELQRVFPEHAERGTLWSVHSPLTQKARDLQRFEPFDVIEVVACTEKKKQADFIADQLLALGAFQNRHYQIGWEQARRLARVAVIRKFSRGDTILRKDDDVRTPENNKVHVILRGSVSVAEEGREIREGEKLGPGDLFGERAIFGAEVTALSYWQIPERRRAQVLTRHEFESSAYYTWNPGLTEEDIATEFEPDEDLREMLLGLFRATRKLQRTRTAVVLENPTHVLDIKADEFFKIFEHFDYAAADLEAAARDEKIRETLGALVLSSASAGRRMRMDDFVALVERNHLDQVMEPVFEMARAKLAGDPGEIQQQQWPVDVFENGQRKDPVSRVIDANLSAFLSFACVFHDQYVSDIEIVPYLDCTRATPERLRALVEEGALDGESERVRAYIARYSNPKKHVKLQRRDVKDPRRFAEAIAARSNGDEEVRQAVTEANARTLLKHFQTFPDSKDILSSLYAEWDTLIAEINRSYDQEAREPYKDYLARLQTKAIANILTILLHIRNLVERNLPLPSLDEVLLWIHAAWSLDNDWAEQAAMAWSELEKHKPGDIKKDWIALLAVVEQLDFKADFEPLLSEGQKRFGGN